MEMKQRHYSGETALTKAEWSKLKQSIGDIEDECLISLAICTGLRREDIVSIRVKDIDLDQQCLTYFESKKRRTRSAFFTTNMAILLEKYLKTKAKSEWLFNFSGRTAWNRLNKWCIRAGIKPRPFHSLRATSIKFMQAEGWSVEAAASFIGDTVAVVQQHYSAPSQAELKEFTVKNPII